MIAKAVINQGVLDLAVQLYGNAESLSQLLSDKVTGDFDISTALQPGTDFSYDIEKDVANKKVLQRMDGVVVNTYRITGIFINAILTEDGFAILTEDGKPITTE